MQRHSHNPSLSLYAADQYEGLPVLTSTGPLIEQYLSRIYQVSQSALIHHPRTFAFRLDLRYPVDYVGTDMESNQIIERFMASFKAKLLHNRNKARQANPYAHSSGVRYIWCREHGEQGNGAPHYHMVIFLNNDAFCNLGRFQLGLDNLFNRLHEAWASALSRNVQDVYGLIEFPQDSQWLLQRDNQPVMENFFHRASYLTKSQTKHYHCGTHAFGSSRG